MESIVVGGLKITLLGRDASDDGQFNCDIALSDLSFDDIKTAFEGNDGITILDENDEVVAQYFGYSVLSYINMFFNFGFDVPAAGVCVKQASVNERLEALEKDVDEIKKEILEKRIFTAENLDLSVNQKYPYAVSIDGLSTTSKLRYTLRGITVDGESIADHTEVVTGLNYIEHEDMMYCDVYPEIENGYIETDFLPSTGIVTELKIGYLDEGDPTTHTKVTVESLTIDLIGG